MPSRSGASILQEDREDEFIDGSKKILDAALQRWHTYQLTKIEQSAKESDISVTEKHYLPAKKKEGM
jgi:hypothetical protein